MITLFINLKFSQSNIVIDILVPMNHLTEFQGKKNHIIIKKYKF
jgi:hypothetical protein